MWRTTPLPVLRELLLYYRAFNADELRRIAYALVPSDMDEKWFVSLDHNLLHVHRG